MSRLHPLTLVFVLTCASLAILFSTTRNVYAVNDGSIAAKSDAQTENPATAIATPTVLEKGTAVSNDAAAQKAGAKALKRRAGEQVDGDATGRASVLGMHLQEADSGRVKIVEVGTTTPAFDAGLHEGDEILSFQGFSADSYRKWIDGIHKLTTDAPADSRIPVVVLREGKRMALRIRIPEKVVRTETSRALAQQAKLQNQTAVGPIAPVPTGPTGVPANGGNNVLIDNGQFGDSFNDETSSPNERAMAEIFRLNSPRGTVGAAGPTPGGPRQVAVPGGAAANAGVEGTAPAAGGARIGLAGFRDDPSGLVVMVDAGALPPGNYIVGIGDPSVMGTQNPAGTVAPNPPNQLRSGQFAPPVATPPVRDPNLPQPAAPAAPQGAPAVPAAGARAPQSSLQTIPRTVLAQVSANGQPGSSSVGTDTAAGPTEGTTIPPTGRVNPTTTRPTGQSGVNDGQRNAANLPAKRVDRIDRTGTGTTDATALTDTGVSGGLNEIGTLTVDQSGTGRMQKTVEGVQVRNVVGQAIVIFAPAGQQTTLPANLNGNAGAATRQGVIDSNSALGAQGAVAGAQGGANSQAVAAGQTQGRLPVAAGIIRLVSDRRPATTGTDATETPTTGVNTGVQQPETATPAAGQNLVR